MLTPKFNFYLQNLLSDNPILIYMQAKFNYERLMISAGEKISKKDWDFVAQRAIVSRNKKDYSQLNDWLDKMELAGKEAFRDFKFKGITPTAEILKANILEALNLNPIPKKEEVKVKKETLLSFIEKFIRESSSRVSYATIQTYQTTKKHICNYCAQQHKHDLDFEEINHEFYNLFKVYLYSLNHSEHTVAKQIKNLKVFLGEATERGINKNMFFRSKTFKKPTEDVDKIFLTEDEIQKIYQLDLRNNTGLEFTRDLFIIACYTGFRFSDFTTLKKEHIGESFITKKTIKTKAKVIIPIHGTVREIFEKYNYNLFVSSKNQVINRHLKEIAKKAEINEEIEIIKKLGGVSTRTVYKKWELVSSHTGRRSFATNSYLSGVPTIAIMFITGHSTESAFMSYICIDELQNARQIQNHPFFNKNNFNQAA